MRYLFPKSLFEKCLLELTVYFPKVTMLQNLIPITDEILCFAIIKQKQNITESYCGIIFFIWKSQNILEL